MFNLKIMTNRAQARLFKTLALCLTLLLCGCATHAVIYNEHFSETDVSSDFSKVLVSGRDQYSYLIELPPPIAAALQSPLKSGLVYHFPDCGTLGFSVDKDGNIEGYFTAILPDEYLEGRHDLVAKAKRLGFIHGRLISVKECTNMYDDGVQPTWGSRSQAEMEKISTVLGSGYSQPFKIKGKRILRKDAPSMQDAFHYTIGQHAARVADEQHETVDPLAPIALALGAGACISVLPVCLAASLPMAGLRP